MNIVDVCIILLLLMGAVVGFKRGVIKSLVSLVGTILVVVLSFYLKNPLSVFLYTYLPFFNFGLTALNILLYESIAFLIVFIILSAILRVIIKISGLLELALKFTVVLAIPSKILGAVVGFLEYYVFVFIALFLLSNASLTGELFQGSKLADKMLKNTPVLSNIIEDNYKGVQEIISISKNVGTNKETANQEAIDVLLKYNIVSIDNVNKLKNKNKFTFDIENIIVEYKK